MSRYRPDVAVSFLVKDLAFESEEACCQFLCEHGGEQMLLKKGEAIRFATSKAAPAFEARKASLFRTVDIKGQK